jgi:succinate-acetate transporter protein
LYAFVLSCYSAGIFGVSLSTLPNVVTGLAVFYGGLAQLLAGVWEFKTGNTFDATAFSSYGAFWLAYAAIQIPIAIFLLSWTIFTFIMWLGIL